MDGVGPHRARNAEPSRASVRCSDQRPRSDPIGIVIPDPEGTFGRFADDLADACGVSQARMVRELGEVEVEDLREEPRCERSRKRDGTVRERSDGTMLSDRDAAAIGLD